MKQQYITPTATMVRLHMQACILAGSETIDTSESPDLVLDSKKITPMWSDGD